MDRAAKTIDWLNKPAPANWVSGRIVTLLSHYFITQTDERIAKAIAEDWIVILSELPAWAISNACRNYLAGDDCKRKPVPGDIRKLAEAQRLFIRKFNNWLTAEHQANEQSLPVSTEERKRVGKMMAQLAADMKIKTASEENDLLH